MIEVTDKMFNAAWEAWRVAYNQGLNWDYSMRASIEAAIAAREPREAKAAMVEVTEKMIDACRAFGLSLSPNVHGRSMCAAIEAAFAASDPVDAEKLVKELRALNPKFSGDIGQRSADVIEELVEALQFYADSWDGRARAVLTRMGVKL